MRWRRVCDFGLGGRRDSIGRKSDGYKLEFWRARLKSDVDLVECAGAACIGALGHLVGESALTRLRKYMDK